MPTNKRVPMRGADAFLNPLPEPVQQKVHIPTEKDTNIPVQNTTSTPVQSNTAKLVKASYYITSELDMKLERIRLKRRERGEKIDKSALVREALEALKE